MQNSCLGLLGTCHVGVSSHLTNIITGLNEGGDNETFLFALYNTPWGWGLLFALLCVLDI